MVVQKPENVLRVSPFIYPDVLIVSSAPKVPKSNIKLLLLYLPFCVELIAVGKNQAALQSLHEIITSKRSKSASLQSLEPIMLRFVELCVNLRKGKMAKEGLYQFKNIAQNTNVSSIEVSPNFSISCQN